MRIIKKKKKRKRKKDSEAAQLWTVAQSPKALIFGVEDHPRPPYCRTLVTGCCTGTCAVGSLAATTFRLLLPLSPSSGQIDSTTRVLGGAELLGGQGWPRNLLERVAPLWLHQICATRTVVGDRQPDFLSPTRGHSQSLHQEFKWSTSLSTVVFYFKNQTF